MSAAAGTQGIPTEAGIEVVASLAQHRVLSTEQVRVMHLADHSERWAQRLLVRLQMAGLAGYVQSPRSHRRLWHVTELGARLARVVRGPWILRALTLALIFVGLRLIIKAL